MPPVPTSSSSSYRPERTSPTMRGGGYPPRNGLEHRLQRGLPHVQRLVELDVRDDERYEDADAVAVHARLQQQEPALQRLHHDLRRQGGRRLLAVDELECEHRAEPPDVRDLGPARPPALHA